MPAMSVAEVYRKTRKPVDIFWNVYVARPVAAALVYALRDTRVTPNQVTLSAFVVCCIAAVGIVFAPGYWGLLGSIIVFELSYVLDCVDGMLARWRGTQSMPGHLFDFLMDEIKAFIVLSAVAVRLYLDGQDERFLLLGLGGLVCLATGISITTFQRRPEIAPKPAEGTPAKEPSLVGRAIGLAEWLGKFFIHYPSYILYTAIAARIDVYLYAYIGANALYAARGLAQVAWRMGRK